MKNKHDGSKNLLLGLLAGGAIGAAALYLFRSSHHAKASPLQKIGHSLSEVGEMLENFPPSKKELGQELGKKFPNSTDMLSTISDWIDSGISLWKSMTK